MKHYIVYQGKNDWLSAALISSEGECLAQHICSAPGYMYGDLYGRRLERQKEWPDLDIDRTPYYIDDFKKLFPEVYEKHLRLSQPTMKARRMDE